MTSRLPEWRKAWRLDDPAWVKQRKAEWKRINKILVDSLWYRKDELTAIKNFFMTGSCYSPELPQEKWALYRYDPDKTPLQGVPRAPLIECWLTADQSEENWRHIQEKYGEELMKSARERLREWMCSSFPEEGCLFDGLETRLYYQFPPTRCRPEDYPEEHHGRFINTAWGVYSDLKALIKPFFINAKLNPCNIAPIVLREWCDALPWTYEALVSSGKGNEKVMIGSVVEIVERAVAILNAPERFESVRVEAARDLLRCLAETDLRWDELKAAVAPYLPKAD